MMVIIIYTLRNNDISCIIDLYKEINILLTLKTNTIELRVVFFYIHDESHTAINPKSCRYPTQ